jgi:hypothetical protein
LYPISIAFDGPPKNNGGLDVTINIENGGVRISETPRPVGDVNGDGIVDLFDAILIARYFADHPDLDLLAAVPALDLDYGIVTIRSQERGLRPMDASAIAMWFARHDTDAIIDPNYMPPRPH